MRVISGIARGHKLAAPRGRRTRPTGDRMKEDLFNILGPEIKESIFLDLYCGSGAIGIEALSRGAARAVFVDESREAIDSTKANLIKTRLDSRAEVLHMTARQSLKYLSRRIFDIIFMDPPYNSTDYIELEAMLSDDGIVIVECSYNIVPPDFKKLILYRQKKYSQMQFLLYRKEADR